MPLVHMRDELTPEELQRLGAITTTDGRTVGEVLAGAPVPHPVVASDAPQAARAGRALWIARSQNGGRAPEGEEPAAPKLNGRDAMMYRMANGGNLPGEGGSR